MANVISYWKRDPFARGSVARQISDRSDHECDWCGQERNRLYYYGWSSDDGKEYINEHRAFCNYECFKCFFPY